MLRLARENAVPFLIALLALGAMLAGPPAQAQGPLPPPGAPATAIGPPPPTPTPPPPPREPLRPQVSRSLQNDVSPPLRSIPPIPPDPGPAVREIPRLVPPRGGLARRVEGLEEPDRDPVLQDQPSLPSMPSPSQSFEGVSNVDGVLPPDTNGDVGPNHYVQWVNLSFAIWNKSGTLLYGPANGNTLWSGFGGACQTENDGDPIVLYDPLADRWLMSQFAKTSNSGPFYQCIAISQTPDPTGAWYRYAFLVHNTKFNDYPKFGVWPDGYYMTANQFAWSGSAWAWAGAGVFVFDRASMLAGNSAATSQYFDLSSANVNFAGMLPSDLDGARSPPAGAPNYFVEVDDSTWIGPSDALRLWEFHVDWATPANSTFGLSGQPNAVLTTAAWAPLSCVFVTRDCIPQPGVPSSQYLDAIGDNMMYRLAYRNLGDHESLVVNHTVNAGSGVAGVRWYEIRDPGGSPAIYQQGTYSPDSSHRWMGSIAMDGNGNMALGYSVSSSTVYPSIRYTGRLVTDTLGTMPQGETTLIAGSGSQTDSSSRWGDYSMMAVDPADDCTFWYTQEYYQATSSSSWRTRIGSFKFPSCVVRPDLANSGETVSMATASPGQAITYTVSLSNTGDLNAFSARITDTLPLSLTYTTGSASGGAVYVASTRAITWTGVVTVGTPISITYSGVISGPLDNGSLITNTATVYDGVNAPFETAAVTTTISSSPNLSASAKGASSATASPGQALTYTLTLTNTGDMNASARLTDTLPLSLTYASGSASGGATHVTATHSITWTGVVTAGGALSITYSGVITSPLDNGSLITNTATIYDGVNAPWETAPVITTISSSPNLSTSAKGASSATASPGQALTYTVTLSNTGTFSATTRLTDTLPLSLTYTTGSASGGAIYVAASRSITWTGVVTAGGAFSITYSGVISSPLDNGSLITNTATIYDGLNPPFETAPVTTTISSSPNLSTSAKGVSAATASPGQALTYTLTLTNTGNMNATARLTDTLPLSLTYASGSASSGASYSASTRAITWSGVVTAGGALSITYSGVITSPLDSGSLITNTATLYDGVNAPWETTPVTTTIFSSPNLSTSAKGVSAATASPGQALTYTLTLTNTGDMSAQARLTDTLPINLTYVTGSAGGGASYDAGSRTITWSGVVTAASALSLTYQAVITASLTTIATITNVATIYGAVNPAFETAPVTTTVTPTVWRAYAPYLAKNYGGW